MAGKWQEGSRLDAAKAIITHMADSLAKENISFALRIYGHQSEKSLIDVSYSIACGMNQKVRLEMVILIISVMVEVISDFICW